jgi:hypothetical protein
MFDWIEALLNLPKRLNEIFNRINELENNVLNLQATYLRESDLEQIKQQIAVLNNACTDLQQALVARSNQEFTPLSTRIKPWRIRQQEFERKDIEMYWKNKGGMPLKETDQQQGAKIDEKAFFRE